MAHLKVRDPYEHELMGDKHLKLYYYQMKKRHHFSGIFHNLATHFFLNGFYKTSVSSLLLKDKFNNLRDLLILILAKR